jgi:hypothetical protein
MSSLLSSHEACTFRTIILHQRPLNIIYDIVSLANFTLLNADMIFFCTKNLSLNGYLHSRLHRKMYNPLYVQCHPSSIRLPLHRLILTYTSLSPFATVCNEPILQRLLISHVPKRTPIFQCLPCSFFFNASN